jgi:hypothetical protein
MQAADPIALDGYEAWLEAVSGVPRPSRSGRLLTATLMIIAAHQGLPRSELAGEITRAEIMASRLTGRPWIGRMRRRILKLVGLGELGRARRCAREALAKLRARLARAVAPMPDEARPVDRTEVAAIPVPGLLVVATVARSTAPPALVAG